MRIVNIAKEKYKKNQRLANPYDKVWVVFDRDSFPPSDFDNAVHSANANNFGCACSNEAFELWYLLHFEFRNTGMSRTEYKDVLSKYLGEKYKKNDPDMYRKLEKNQEKTIKNSTKLLARHNGTTPSKSNPTTQVHLLVQELNEYKNLV
ncbi:MAG: RloB family protein [Verrucomicrobiota bacterium]|nr:RloB family protein [Verrucomicrobiota bacterium]